MGYLKWLLRSLLLLVLVGGTALRVQAQAVMLPPLAPLTTVREAYLVTFNGRPLVTCQREWAGWNRMHGTCHALETVRLPWEELTAGAVQEFIFYDGTLYQRFNTDTTWLATPDANYNPDLTLNEGLFQVPFAATLTQLGTVAVAGIPTTQYQFWSLDDAYNASHGGQVVYDRFISAEGRVHKEQFSRRGSFPGLGTGELAEVFVYADFNTEIVVARP